MSHQRAHLAIASAVLLAAFLGNTEHARSQPIVHSDPRCPLPEPGRHWLQEALNGWTRIRQDALGLGDGPLPWLVLFDETCVWHLSPDLSVQPELKQTSADLSMNGEPVRVYSAPHTGQILLPNGRLIGTRATASTSVYGGGSATFSLVSMYGVWERDPRHAKQPRLGEFFQGLLIHELTHSTQLIGVTRRIAALRRANIMPGIVDDDVVQRRFGFVIAFRSAIESECNTLYRAVLSTDAARRREWTEKGLSMARKRRARYYVSQSAAFRDLEDVFFAMEGSAQWAAYRLARSRLAPEVSDGEVIKFVRGDRKFWSQDEGLALYLLIDALIPGWQKRTFGDTMASPFAMLEDALKHSDG
jgi:hypothetical protein